MLKRYLLVNIIICLAVLAVTVSCQGYPNQPSPQATEQPVPTETKPSPAPFIETTPLPNPTPQPKVVFPQYETITPESAPQFFTSVDWTFGKLGDEFKVTPGSKLSLVKSTELPPYQGKTIFAYDIKAEGILINVPYILWMKRAWETAPGNTMNVKLNADGIVTNEGGPIKLVMFGYSRGETATFVLYNNDKSIAAACKVVPNPVEAKTEVYHMWMEMVAKDNTMHAIYTEGFAPDEELACVSKSEEEVINSKVKASVDGRTTTLLSPAVIGKENGRASYYLAGKAGTIGITFDWGTTPKK